MIVYRFSQVRYKDDISGTGAKLWGGRWNNVGTPALYSSSTISLSLLEVLVNALTLKELNTLHLLKVEIPVSHESSIQTLTKLKANWYDDFDYTRWIGTEFLKGNEMLILQIPSSVIPEENNYLINPEHKDFGKVKLLTSEKFRFDGRLFKI